MTIERFSVGIITMILSMTFTGSIISLFLFILRQAIKDRLPRSFQYYMWFSVLIALLLPVSNLIAIPETKDFVLPMESMYDIVRRISDITSEKPVSLGFVPENGNGQIATQMAYLPSAIVVLWAVWQSGMVLVLVFHIICYVSYVQRLGRRNRSADRQEIEVLNELQDSLTERKRALRLYKNPMVETPILIGFFRPAVILPDKKYEDVQLRSILMHEVTHRKRHDILTKWLQTFAGAVHWFNPLVHFVCREMDRACELACDEAVIKRLDRNGMQQYGDTLIAVAADSIRKMPLSIAMLEEKKNLKERLGAIMKHKKHSKRTVAAASAALVMAVCVILGFGAYFGRSGYDYINNFPLQDQMRIREIRLKEVIRDYDEENIAMAAVHLDYSDDGNITRAYINISGQEENPDSDMLSGIISLASEELELDISDISDICLDYVDFETSTLRVRVGE